MMTWRERNYRSSAQLRDRHDVTVDMKYVVKITRNCRISKQLNVFDELINIFNLKLTAAVHFMLSLQYV